MFELMRSALGITKSIDILDHVHSLPLAEASSSSSSSSDPQVPTTQEEAFAKIRAIEREAMTLQIPQAGLVTLMEFLDRHKILKGICTRNFDAPVNHLLTKNIPSHINPFSPIITRDFRPPKPSPAGILHIAQAWGIIGEGEAKPSPELETGQEVQTSPGASSSEDFDPETTRRRRRRRRRRLPLIMVGDSVDDMAAGRDAGALTVLLRSKGKEELEKDPRTDVVISRLDELIGLLERGLEARARV
jgi:phosphoglycolate phosphatase-like HAD superfamily hydrolase